jgi:glycosyltransferase involved in cell wall biosynthesis
LNSFEGAESPHVMRQHLLKVGVDVVAIQSPASGRDEVGLHVFDVVEALLKRAGDDGTIYVLYTHDGLPDPGFAESRNATAVTFRHQRSFSSAAAIEALLGRNPDGLDAFLVLDPFDPRPGHGPPPRFPAGPLTLAYVQDVSPFVLQDGKLLDVELGDRLYRHLERLRSYDFLIAANEVTCGDIRRLLGLPASRVLAPTSLLNCPEAIAGVIARALIDPPTQGRPRRTTIRRRSTVRRLALFSPFAPKHTGVADHADYLARALRPDYAVDLFHEAGYVPETALASPDFGSFDERLYPRLAAEASYHGTLFQIGNSHFHTFMHERLLETPGIVTLHDFCLACYHASFGQRLGSPVEYLHRVVADSEPGWADELIARFTEWQAAPGGIPIGLGRAGAGLSRRIIEAGSAVVVHSQWCRDQIKRHYPEFVSKVTVIPLGADADRPTPQARADARARFGLPADALILGTFGALASERLNVESIKAFAGIIADFPGSVLIFVGEDWTGGEANREAGRLALSERVRFLGRTSAADYHSLVAAVDIGVSLRRPPTHGETSASLLDLLRRGIPTVVIDTGTFGEYPDSVVRKVRWDDAGPQSLALALRELASSATLRRSLGDTALTHVVSEHSWSRVASLYAVLIDRTYDDARRQGSARVRPFAATPSAFVEPRIQVRPRRTSVAP